MDYKKLIKNRKVRLKVLEIFNWIPDKLMITIQYKIKTGRILNLKKTIRYTEKIQWYKLYYKDSLMIECSDKYLVRQYVKNKGLSYILNDLYGVYDNVNNIDFTKLPNKFILKKTNGAGGNEVLICKNSSSFDVEKAKEIMAAWTLKKNNGGGREWIYYEQPPKIIAEKLLETNDLIDYKFFCFNGEPHYLYIINGRKLGEKVFLGIFNMSYEQLPYFRSDENRMIEIPPKPANFEAMVDIARKLSEDFPHVRVDLYNLDGNIFFGELTFFDGSGYQSYHPDEFDYILGEKFNLPEVVL